MPLHDEVVLAGHQALQDVEHAVGEVRAQLGRRAEIEHDDARLALGPLLHEEVSGVRIGVEEPIDEQLLVEHLDQLGRDVVRIEIERVQRVLLRDLDAVHERHRHHRARRPLADRPSGTARPDRSSKFFAMRAIIAASLTRSVSRSSMSASCSCTRSICCTGTKFL